MATFKVQFLNLATTRTWQRIGRLVGYLVCLAALAALLYGVGAFREVRAWHSDDPRMDCVADLPIIGMWAAMRDDGVSKVEAIPLIVPTEQQMTEMELNAKQRGIVRKRSRLGIQLIWEQGLKDNDLFDAWMEQCVKLGESI